MAKKIISEDTNSWFNSFCEFITKTQINKKTISFNTSFSILLLQYYSLENVYTCRYAKFDLLADDPSGQLFVREWQWQWEISSRKPLLLKLGVFVAVFQKSSGKYQQSWWGWVAKKEHPNQTFQRMYFWKRRHFLQLYWSDRIKDVKKIQWITIIHSHNQVITITHRNGWLNWWYSSD